MPVEGLTWTRKRRWRAVGPDGEFVRKPSGGANFNTPEELWEAIAHSPYRGDFEVDPARYVVSKAYGVLPPELGDTTPPSVPQGVGAVATSATEIVVQWLVSTDDVGVAGYTIWRDGAPIGTAAETSYTDTGLAPSTLYTYEVAAYDAAGNSSQNSDPTSATTASNAAPAWSLLDQSLDVGAFFSLDLDTVCSDADDDSLTYSIVSGSVSGLSLVGSVYSGTPDTAEAPSITFRADDGIVTADTAVTFTITEPDTTAPATPSGLSGTNVTGTSVDIDWDDNAESDFSHYVLYQSLDDVSYGIRANNLTTSDYQDTGLNAGTTYYYKVSAVDTIGNESAQTSALSVTTSSVGPSFDPISDITFASGTAGSSTATLNDPSSEVSDAVIWVGDALPSGVSISDPGGPGSRDISINYDGTAGTGTATGVLRTLDTGTGVMDFDARVSSVGADVVQKINFSTAEELEAIDRLRLARTSSDSTWDRAGAETTIKASGLASLRQTIEDVDGISSAPDWGFNVGQNILDSSWIATPGNIPTSTPNPAWRFGARSGGAEDLGDVFCVQWKQYWETNALNIVWDIGSGRGGNKIIKMVPSDHIDSGGSPQVMGATVAELTLTNHENSSLPGWYNSSSPTRHLGESADTRGMIDYVASDGRVYTGTQFDILFQNAVDNGATPVGLNAPGQRSIRIGPGDALCSSTFGCNEGSNNQMTYSGFRTLPSEMSHFFNLRPNQWITFQVRVTLGALGTDTDGYTIFENSQFEFWGAYEGQASQKILDIPFDIRTIGSAEGRGFGKFYWVPFQTGLNPQPGARDTYNTYVDEIIVAKSIIPDPATGTAPT